MAILIKNIKELVQTEEIPMRMVAGKAMSVLNTLKDAWLLIEDTTITDFGTMPVPDSVNIGSQAGNTIIDAHDRLVFPSFCDSHTHLVYAGSREIEYIDKIKGLSYEEIAKRGGGILNSAKRLHDTGEDELVEQGSRSTATSFCSSSTPCR